MKEPLWRSILCWGTVITFLTMPLIVLVIAITARLYGWMGLEEHLKGYKFLGAFYQSVTALTFGLSGLRSLDRFIETKNGNSKTTTHEK
jgi:fumarate reductase subunit D